MLAELHPPLKPPKNGLNCDIILVGRVSDPGPGKQDLRSLEDQEKLGRDWLAANVVGNYKLTVVAGSGSGELLNRDEFLRLSELVDTRRYDLIFGEDLGRVMRRMQAYIFCESCEDTDTRMYARNDRVDTAVPNWREAAIFAAFHHERSNRDTSERIKRTHRSRFVNGGCLRPPPFGWLLPSGAKSDSETTKDLRSTCPRASLRRRACCRTTSFTSTTRRR